jgi:hypothetical protein
MEVPTYEAIRLVFEYAGDKVRLVSQQDGEIGISAFDMSGAGRPGYYVDTRNASGATLARVAVPAAFGSDPPRGVFTVVVPAARSASHVVLTRIARAARTARDASARSVCSAVTTDIATFPLGRRTEPGGTP